MDASIEGFVKALGGGVGAVGGLRTNSIFSPLKWTEIKIYVFIILDTNLKIILNCNMELANKNILAILHLCAKIFTAKKLFRPSCLARPCSTHWK